MRKREGLLHSPIRTVAKTNFRKETETETSAVWTNEWGTDECQSEINSFVPIRLPHSFVPIRLSCVVSHDPWSVMFSCHPHPAFGSSEIHFPKQHKPLDC